MRHEEDVVADARLAGALAVAYEAYGVGIARNARTWDRGLLHNDAALAYIARLVPRLLIVSCANVAALRVYPAFGFGAALGRVRALALCVPCVRARFR